MLPKFWWFSQTQLEFVCFVSKAFHRPLNGSNMASILEDMTVQTYHTTVASPVTGRQLSARSLVGAFQKKLRYYVDCIQLAYEAHNTRPLPYKPSRVACRCHRKPATSKTSAYHPHLWRTICRPNFDAFLKKQLKFVCFVSKAFQRPLNGSNMPSIKGDMIVQIYQKTAASPVTGRQLSAGSLVGAFQTKLRYSVDSIHKAYRDQNTRPLPGKPSRAACRCHGKPATGKTSP